MHARPHPAFGAALACAGAWWTARAGSGANHGQRPGTCPRRDRRSSCRAGAVLRPARPGRLCLRCTATRDDRSRVPACRARGGGQVIPCALSLPLARPLAAGRRRRCSNRWDRGWSPPTGARVPHALCSAAQAHGGARGVSGYMGRYGLFFQAFHEGRDVWRILGNPLCISRTVVLSSLCQTPESTIRLAGTADVPWCAMAGGHQRHAR